ncbi:MAG: branched-chain amino acid ABC transporter permease [Acidimicrobiia bacterium]
MDLSTTMEAALRGAVVGTGNGLLALALVLTFRSTGVLNLALGGIASVAAFVLWDLWAAGDLALIVALPLAVAAAVALALAGEVALRPLRKAPVVVKAVATLGLLLVIQAGIFVIWGPADQVLPPLLDGAVAVGDVRIGTQQIITAAIAVAAALALGAWSQRRPLGLASLAVAEDDDAARLLGVRPERVAAAVWGASGILAGMAGVGLSGGLAVLNATEMTLALVTSLAAALLAGFDRLGVAVAAAAAVGGVTAAAASVPGIARTSGMVESLGFLAVLAVVFLRPRAAVPGRA